MYMVRHHEDDGIESEYWYVVDCDNNEEFLEAFDTKQEAQNEADRLNSTNQI